MKIVETEEELHILLLQAEAEGRIRPQIPEEAYKFCKLLLGRPFSRVIEIGVGIASTPVWLMLLEEEGLVVGIDPDQRTNDWIVKSPYCVDVSRFVFLCGRSEDPVIVSKVESYFDKSSVDLLFIDGDHSYSGPVGIGGGVRSDFDKYKVFVRPGGLIAFHDIFTEVFDGPQRVFKELREAGYRTQTIGAGALGIGVIFV